MKKNIGKILAVILVVSVLATVLCACVPSKFTKAEANLKENGYAATTVGNGELVNGANAMAKVAAAALDVTLTGKCDNIVTGVSKDGKQSVTITTSTMRKTQELSTKLTKQTLRKLRMNSKNKKTPARSARTITKKLLKI